MSVISKVKNRFNIKVKAAVVSIFIFSILITATVAILLQSHFSSTMALEYTSRIFSMTTKNTSENLSTKNKNIEETLEKLVRDPEIKNYFSHSSEFSEIIKIFQSNNNLYGIYIADDSGSFFEVINLESSPIVRSQMKASSSDRWVTIEIYDENNEKLKKTTFYDQHLTASNEIIESTEYNPVNRFWFSNATSQSIYKSPPYLFQHLQSPGQTYSLKIPYSNNTVVAIDIALESISEYLLHEDFNDPELNAEMFVFQKEGQLIASNLRKKEKPIDIPKSPSLTLSQRQRELIDKLNIVSVSNELDWAPLDFSASGKPSGYSVDVMKLIGESTGLKINFINGFSWSELVGLFNEDKLNILSAAYNNETNQRLGLISKPFLKAPFSMVTQSGVEELKSLDQLNGKTVAIPAGWSIIKIIKEHYPKINIVEVPSTIDVLKKVHDGEYFSGIDNNYVLQYTAKQYFIDDLKYHTNIESDRATLSADLHFLVSKEKSELLDIINLAIDHITPEQRQVLTKKWLLSESKNYVGVLPYKELLDFVDDPENYNQLLKVKIDGKISYLFISKLNRHEEYFALLISQDSLFKKTYEKLQISIFVTALLMIILFPLCWFFASPIVEPIKSLAKESAKIKRRQYKDVKFKDSRIIEIQELNDSMLDMTDSIQSYQQKQKELMDSFIELIGQAIDDKSPYTAGHCERVPELGMLLATAASNDTSSAFNAFRFENDEEVREFKIAAWLHDCGKITTPEHIVDKGSKLEAVYNRIHEIRMRFEVLRRDAEIEYYKKMLLNPELEAQFKEEKERSFNVLNEDFAFIAKANVGSEFMSEDIQKRLTLLSEITWQRHFDDRLGLSPHEERKLTGEGSALPVTETLLSDKPEHLIPHHKPIVFDEKLGIKMIPPEHQANLGELYNLSISRGTLTKEDRFKINEHIISTIRMLDSLPFHEELSRVPRYASTHHETLIGTGYPRQLTGESLSIPERVLVLADIFEALTASDRPYKKAKPLSVSIKILHKMALDLHVDMDIFKLFLSSGVYLQYADKFLSEGQKDYVDIDYYLNYEIELKNSAC
ncbi:HD domain-containing phosphohydrolase [Marinomonas sp. 2405UD68-3]|uniref:HD domain-containing phosphohydrolase n=1 Tax=Marinomonas sp. 2405UD68-3 TaxID=3391835 RepID=UPI0039C97532